jgi:hypothetical protein
MSVFRSSCKHGFTADISIEAIAEMKQKLAEQKKKEKKKKIKREIALRVKSAEAKLSYREAADRIT